MENRPSHCRSQTGVSSAISSPTNGRITSNAICSFEIAQDLSQYRPQMIGISDGKYRALVVGLALRTASRNVASGERRFVLK